LLRRAQGFNRIVSKFAPDLREFAELRNAITHTRRENFVIAEPHDEVVKLIRQIRDLLYDPPRVSLLASPKPYYATPGTSIREVLETFAIRDFIRCPVIDKNTIVCLLTAKTLTRWVASNFNDLESLRNARVSDVMRFSERQDFAIAGRETDLFEVLDLFKRALRTGMHLQAVIITANGKPDGTLLGIITPSDLPRIVEITAGKQNY
jgi:predicted transcriptional regulator